jgi:hypothetical protein
VRERRCREIVQFRDLFTPDTLLHTGRVRIDQEQQEDKTLCYVGATQSFSGYGPWLCCNHAKVEGWAGYDEAACSHCRVRASSFNRHTGMAAMVKGVPEHLTRPTSGWTYGKGKAKKRLLLHNKRLEPQTEVCALRATRTTHAYPHSPPTCPSLFCVNQPPTSLTAAVLA